MGARQMTSEPVCPGAAKVTDISIQKHPGVWCLCQRQQRSFHSSWACLEDSGSSRQHSPALIPPTRMPQPTHLWARRAGISHQVKKKKEMRENKGNAVPSSYQWHPPAWGLVVNPVLSSKHGGNNSSPSWHKRANCYSLLFTLSRGHLTESNSNMDYSLHLENSAPT